MNLPRVTAVTRLSRRIREHGLIPTACLPSLLGCSRQYVWRLLNTGKLGAVEKYHGVRFVYFGSVFTYLYCDSK